MSLEQENGKQVYNHKNEIGWVYLDHLPEGIVTALLGSHTV